MDLSTLTEEIFQSSDTKKLEENCKNFSQKIVSKEIKLVSLVEALGSKLTSTDAQIRVKGVEILANVFQGLPRNFLLEQELNFIITFLHDRLKDQHIVIPQVILCIHSIIQCENLPEGASKSLLYQIFREANIQSHVHKIRRTFFLSVRYLLINKLEELKEMASDFLVNFLQCMDGEKDPRNLQLLFNFIPLILNNFPLAHFEEDFFDVMACYFPIDFSPNANVPGVEIITRDDLALSLHKCLSHTNQFSRFLIPLALEKLESSLIDAKLDALSLLEMCCDKSYQPSDLEPFLGQLWHNLRREIFLGGNEAVEKECILFLKSSFKIISKSEPMLDHCLTMIFTECNHHLCEPELRLINPTSRILVGMAESCELACIAVLQRSIPVLYEQLSAKSTISEKKRILNIMGLLISSSHLFPKVQMSDLLTKWDDVIAMWFTFLTHDDQQFVTLALELFIQVLPSPVDLDLKNRTLLQEHILSLLKKSDIIQETRSSIISTIDEFSKYFPKEFLETSIPSLLQLLEGDIDSSAKRESESRRSTILAAVAECSPNDAEICETVVAYLLNSLNSQPHDIAVLNCISRIVTKGCSRKVENIRGLSHDSFIDLVCIKLMVLDKVVSFSKSISQEAQPVGPDTPNDHNILSVASCEEKEDWSTDPFRNKRELFDVSTSIVRNIVKACSCVVQKTIVNTFWGKVKVEGVKAVFSEMPILLLESLLSPLRPSIEIESKKELLQHLILCGTSVDDRQSESVPSEVIAAQRLYAVLLNKANSDVEFQALVHDIEEVIDSELGLSRPTNEDGDTSNVAENDMERERNGKNDKLSLTRKQDTVSFLAWVVKSLALRGVDFLDRWMDKLIVLLEDVEVGSSAAEGFGVIMSDCEISLNAQCYCNYKFLYKQRLFLMTVPKLVHAHKRCSNESAKANFIRALSFQLKHVPMPVLFMEIDNVLPLLVASLSCESSNKIVLISTLTALSELLTSSNEKLKEYFHDIAPRLLRLTRFKDSMKVRELSLSCLKICAKFPTHIILPLKPMIVDELKRCLDDPKRIVRKEAALTRNKWIVL